MATAKEDDHTLKPLCFGYLASYLRKHVPEAGVAVFESIDDLIAARPDVVGFSATTTNFNLARDYAVRVKDALGVPVLLGGVHVSVLPHRLPEAFDVGVVGEGEETMRELATLRARTGRFAAADLAKVAGIVYRDPATGTVARTDARALIHPLDQIPRPDRRAIGHVAGRAYMFTSRGCPYDCSFCSSQLHWGRYRTFSPAYVLDEIGELIADHGVREIHFFDDLFVANVPRLTAIADGIVARGWQKEVEFSCTIRANVADERLMGILERMEVRRVTFGAESGSDPILRYLKGDNVTAEMNQRAVDLCHRHGIRIGPSFIKGAPDETGDDLLATYDFILRNLRAKKIDYFEIHNLTPFPGTPVWDHALARGLVSEEMDWDEMKVPWERLYLNDRIPKSAFYFFETLTKKGQEMLGIFARRIVGIVDVTDRLDALDEGGATRIATLLERLRGDRFLDVLHVVDLAPDAPARAAGRKLLADAGVGVVSPPAFAEMAADPRDADLVVTFEARDDADPEKVYAAVWRHFETGADLTRYAETKFFTPTDPFERRVFVFSARAFARAYRVVTTAAEKGDPFPDLGPTFLTGEYRVEIYRPDADPFVPASAAARLFGERLARDFKLDRMTPEKRAERIAIIEERIVRKTADLPRIEKRRRDLARSGLGRRIKGSDSALLKGLVKFLFYRD
jgi:radical SAM superfamily enzyme YgiQ (UPF0313 family)